MTQSLVVQQRFPRVFLTSVLRELTPLEGCKVIWPSGFESNIFDFGRAASSVYFPMRLGLVFFKGDLVRLGWRFGSNDPISFETRVIRAETRLLTVELFRLSPSHYKNIESYFTNGFIAKHMQFVPPEHYAAEQTFSTWFHGPLDTNLYLWQDQGHIERLCLEFREIIFNWDRKKGVGVGPSRDTLSYSTEDYSYYSHTLAELRPAIGNDTQQVVDFLCQVPQLKSINTDFLKELKHGSQPRA